MCACYGDIHIFSFDLLQKYSFPAVDQTSRLRKIGLLFETLETVEAWVVRWQRTTNWTSSVEKTREHNHKYVLERRVTTHWLLSLCVLCRYNKHAWDEKKKVLILGKDKCLCIFFLFLPWICWEWIACRRKVCSPPLGTPFPWRSLHFLNHHGRTVLVKEKYLFF